MNHVAYKRRGHVAVGLTYYNGMGMKVRIVSKDDHPVFPFIAVGGVRYNIDGYNDIFKGRNYELLELVPSSPNIRSNKHHWVEEILEEYNLTVEELIDISNQYASRKKEDKIIDNFL